MSVARLLAVAALPLLGAAACASNEAADPGTTGGASARGGEAGSVASAGGSAGSSNAGTAGRGGGGASGSGALGAGHGGAAGAGRAGASGNEAGGGGTPRAGAGGSGGASGNAGTSAGAGTGARGGSAGSSAGAGGGGGANVGPVTLTLFDEAVFYDGYASLSSEPVPDGVKRLRNDLLTRRLSDEELDSFQNTLDVTVVIGALCDNYDRIGSVALALVPKESETYDPGAVDRVELGRYITPFMDWNRQPDEVTYEYAADNLIPVLRDPEIRAEFALFFELELFGVPYAANEEVQGCADRSDVFRGSLTLVSDSSAPAPAFDALLPLAYKQPFNDYQQGASDRTGTTRKTLAFELDAATADTQLTLITSNHGANSGGEEYVRRDHFVYVDGEEVLMYKPGRESCEPFRRNNTQANGIYGSSPRSDSEWQSFSNWCPGDRIDTRSIPLGPMSAGSHEFVIDVPDAVFSGDEGDFPLSLYLQSRSN